MVKKTIKYIDNQMKHIKLNSIQQNLYPLVFSKLLFTLL